MTGVEAKTQIANITLHVISFPEFCSFGDTRLESVLSLRSNWSSAKSIRLFLLHFSMTIELTFFVKSYFQISLNLAICSS